MKLFKSIIYFLIGICLVGCNNSQTESAHSTRNLFDDTQGEELIDAGTDESLTQTRDFEIINFKNSRFYSEKKFEGVINYFVELEILNRTNTKITSFSIYPTTQVKFQLSDYSKGWGFDDNNSKYYFRHEVWQPNTSRTFTMIFDGNNPSGIFLRDFERTPEQADIIFEISAISLDREYREQQVFSLINQWKIHQTKLGYR